MGRTRNSSAAASQAESVAQLRQRLGADAQPAEAAQAATSAAQASEVPEGAAQAATLAAQASEVPEGAAQAASVPVGPLQAVTLTAQTMEVRTDLLREILAQSQQLTDFWKRMVSQRSQASQKLADIEEAVRIMEFRSDVVSQAMSVEASQRAERYLLQEQRFEVADREF